MAYVNNGTERSLKVSVYKKVGGNYVQGYPKTYDGQLSWGDISYPTLTDTEARQLSDAEFSARLVAFKSYVASVEPGVDFSTDVVGDGAIRSNEGVCLPTTTTTKQPVWSFVVKYSTSAVLPSACGGIVDTAYSSKQFPGVGDILYADSALSIPWAKGGFVLITNPSIYGTKIVLVAVVSGTYSIGEIIDTENGYDCNSTPVTTTTTTKAAANPIIQVIDENTPSIIQEGDPAINITSMAGSYFQLMFSVKNIGTSVLTVTKVELSSNNPPYELLFNPVGIIQPGQSLAGLVRYTGQANAVAETAVTIYSDAVNDNQFTFTIKYDDIFN